MHVFTGFSRTVCHALESIVRSARRGLPAAVMLCGLAASAPAATLVHDFYLPMPEAQIRTSLLALQSGTGATLDSVFSVVITGVGTQIYYDHWEDGYEADLSHPVQTTTRIWGDGNDANGIPPGYAHDPASFPAGTVLSLRNLVALPRNPATILYDGRDRMAGTKALVVSRVAWATTPGSVLAGAVEVTATIDYGKRFICPVGQDVVASSMFEYVALFVMAAEDNTVVAINGAGPAVNTTLNRGESYHVNGGVMKGATVTATKPVQVQLVTGDINANYETDWFTLYPVEQWYSSYVSPVGTAADGDATFAFFYNTNATPLTINYITRTGSGSFPVPAAGTYQFQIAQNSGARFFNTAGKPFFALAMVGANPAANNVHDWGFTLLPEDALTTEAVVGWGPGSSDLTQNGSPVWVTATEATRVYVDYNGDRNGARTDPAGNKYDEHYDLVTLESRTVYDPDKDQTAMRLYTLDGVPISVAWGQDPAVAGPGNPFLDVGTTVLPFPTPVLKKTSTLAIDRAPTGLSLNDTLEYTITIENKGLLPLGNTLVIDELPATLLYSNNTTRLNGSPISDHPIGTPFPLGEPEGYTIPIILRGGMSEFKFLAKIAGYGSIVNSGFSGTLVVSNEVFVPPPSGSVNCGLAFSDSGGASVLSYEAEGDVYVKLTDADANTSATTTQTVTVVIQNSARSDLELLVLTETGVNTGVFLNNTALPSSASAGLAQQDGILYALAGDTISVGYTDPLYGDTCSDTATISAPSATKVLYLSTGAGTTNRYLDRIDPVAAGDATTAQSGNVGAAAWFNNAWLYRKAITIDYTKVPNTDQTNFPVLINLPSDTDLKARARTDGFDIAFTSSNGTTALSHEREKYTSATGALAAWVKVPTLSHTANTILYMYYGNAGAADQQNKTAVWDSNFKLVYHLADAASPATDSTSNGNNGTATGASFGAAGKIDGATSYVNGNTTPVNYISAGSAPALGANASFTYEMWINVTGAYVNQTDMTSADGTWFLDRTTASNPLVGLIPVGANQFGYETRYDDNTGLGGPTGGTVSTSAGWTHVAMVRDYNTAFRLYVNGVQVGTTTDSGSKALTPPTPKLGRHANFAANTPGLNGSIDEFRISSGARSADWIRTAYNNASSPSTFYTVSVEQGPSVFTQTPAMASAFTMPAGGTLSVRNYVQVSSGTMPTSPDLTATLARNATSFSSLSSPTVTPLGSPGAAYKVGSFTKATGGAPASQSVTHNLGVTPKAILLWTTAQTTTNVTASYHLAQGVSDGTTSYAFSAAAEDGQNNSNTGRRFAAKALTIVPYSGSGSAAEADLSSWSSTTFTLNWTANDANAYIVHYMIVGGSNVSAKVVNWQMSTATGDKAVTGISFRPDLVMHLNGGSLTAAAAPASAVNAAFGFGAMNALGEQWANALISPDGQNTTDTYSIQRTDAILAPLTTAGAVDALASYVSMNTNGFTVNFSDAAANAAQVASLALRGVGSKLGSFNSRTTTGNQALTGVKFRPEAVLLASDAAAASTSPLAHARYLLGAGDGTTQGLGFVDDEDAQNTSDTRGQDKLTRIVSKTAGADTITSQARLSSLDNDGFTLNWSTAEAAYQLLYLALDAPYSVYQVDWSGTLAAGTTVAASEAVKLAVTNREANLAFKILYDSSTYPSKVILPASTIIAVTNLAVYDAPYPGGSPVASPAAGATLYVRATATDPFGAYDISRLGLSIDGPGASGDISTTLTNVHVVASNSYSKTYQYVWHTTSLQGRYDIVTTGHEGSEGITATAATFVNLTFLDLGTPSTTEFTTGNNGPHTLTYATNETVYVRVNDLDQNLNPSSNDTIKVTVLSPTGDAEEITLTETGPNTGIFTGGVTANVANGVNGNNGILDAPAGSILAVNYTDPDDPSDTGYDTATIPTPPGTRAISVNKALVTPNDGQALVDDPIAFEVQVANVGSVTLTNIVFTDTFPAADLTYVSATPAPNTVGAGTLTWNNIGPLTAGQTRTFTVNFTGASAAAPAVNTAAANADSGAATDSDTADVDITNPGQTVTKTLLSPASGPVNYGDSVTFRIVVSNTGDTAIGTLPLEDSFSAAYLDYVSATIEPDATGADSLLWLDLTGTNTLPVGDSITVDVTFDVAGGGNPAPNTATAAYTVDIHGDPVPSASDTTGIVTIASSLTGTVYNDLNTNGGFNAGEPGLAAVTVYLYTDPDGDGNPTDGAVVATTATDASGYYEFLNLGTGNYVVVETDLPGYASSGDTYGLPADNRIAVAITTSGASGGHNFFDYAPPPASYATIAGTVYDDVNANGATDDGAGAVLSGIAVDLVQDLNANGLADFGEPVVASTSTDASGAYVFGGLVAGNYVVRETDRGGYVSTADVVGANNNQIGVSVGAGETSIGNDFLDTAMRQRASIGDRLWVDENADGAQDPGEPGVPNATVQLFDTNGTLVASTVTDGNGGYLFTGMPLGTYTVRVDTASLPAALGANQTFDPDATADGRTVVTLTLATPRVTTADFGYSWAPSANVNNNTGTGAIGDRVWVDADGDGRQDADEPGLGGIAVALVTAGADGLFGTGDDVTTQTTNTDAAGGYIFANVAAGAYQVVVNGGAAPGGYSATGDPDGSGSDNRTTTPILLSPGDVYLRADFGYRPAAASTIGNLVYFDADSSGSFSAGDSSIAGVSVVLLNSNGVAIATTTTDASGAYAFAGVPAGAYTVWVNDTAGLLTQLDQKADPDANLDGRNTLTANGVSAYLDEDFGYAPRSGSPTYGAIGDLIFLDLDGDSFGDTGEGIEGVVVRLYSTNGAVVATTTTDSSGRYAFGGVADGGYIVHVDAATLPAGLSNTVDPDGGTANQSAVTLSGGNDNYLQDFGYRRTASPNTIGGTLWNDLNADGVLQGSETGRYAGVTVVLRDAAGRAVGATTTDADGGFSFGWLPDGTYLVDVTDNTGVLAGAWLSAGPTPGSDDNSQSEPYVVTVSGGDVNTTADFGFYDQGAALGNRVWEDARNDGIQQSYENGLSNIAVVLTVTFPGDGTNVLRTLTDANGYYSFGNLLLDEDFNGYGAGPEPTFVLSLPIPTNLYPAYVNWTANDLLDSDDHNGVMAQALKGVAWLPLGLGASNESASASYDFGLRLSPTLAVIGDFRAVSRGERVFVRWETVMELGTIGFWLERQTASGWARVNRELAVNVAGDGVYETPDAVARPGGTYTYRLIELDNRGRRILYGPYTVTVDGRGFTFEDWATEAFAGSTADTARDADPDGDRLTNFQEYLAGTDPLDRNSLLLIREARAVRDGVALRWRSAEGLTYSVALSTNLGSGFVPVAAGLPATPPVNTYVCPVDGRRAPLYFRVIVSGE